MAWACSKCTYLNPPARKSTCEMCGIGISLSSSSSPSPSLSSSSSPMKWSCKACTFNNTYGKPNCEICGTRSTASLLSTFEELDSIGSNKDLDSSVGSVFFPLRACKRKDQDTITTRTTTTEVSEGFSELGKSGEVKSLRKAETLLSQETISDVSDGIPELGKSTEKSPTKVEALLCQDSTSEVSDGFGVLGKTREGKRKAEALLDQDTIFEVSDGFPELVKFREVKSMGKAGALSGDVTSDGGLSTLKILTYNVWFREDLEMYMRMKAIGDLIQQNSPDVICFQEVTPDIYNLFQKSRWWKVYRCSVSLEMSITRGYFCMQLSKVPVKSFSCKPFRYSAMGRELCVTEIEVEKGKPLVVATSHLESPCPGPPKWDQMYSKERVAQAKEAVDFLNDSPNVIFAGDMNWDDKLDGKFPLPNGWVDAWSELRPDEIGYTYDTKSNKMLSGNRALQKRLDRFLCNFRDFKISGIDMIGMETIPGITYCKEKKVKGVIKNLELPVLPSDHYGLLLTICKK